MNKDVDEKVKELTQQLDKSVSEILTSDRYKAYLKQMSKFHNYSFSNTILIGLQNENATLVAGYQTWKTKFNRNVKVGEKAIRILAPCPFKVKKETEFINKETGEKETKIEEVTFPRFKVVSVFDVSQTEGEPLKEIAIELQGNAKNYEKLFNAIKECSKFEIKFENELDVKGFCSNEDKKIVIKDNMSQNQTIKTLIHEVTHEKLHFDENSKDISRNQEEIEAESVAFVVANYFGIDTSSYSFDYITSWQDKSKSDVKSSLTTIQQTANILIEQISQNLEKEKELSIADKVEIAKSKASDINKKSEKTKNKKKEVIL